jgi:hypothetical protein
MDMQSILFYLNMKSLLPIYIHRDIVATLGMSILGYSGLTRWVRGQSFCPRTERNEIHDQDAPIDEVDGAFLQALVGEPSP